MRYYKLKYVSPTENIKAEFRNFSLNSPDFHVNDVLKVVDATRPKFLALGAYIWNEKYTPDVVCRTKIHHPEITIILGGPQVTYGDCNLAREYPGVDYFIRGEGEAPFTELIGMISRYEIPNQDFLDKHAIYTPETLQNGKCDRIFTVDDLDTLESPYLRTCLNNRCQSHFLPFEERFFMFLS